MTPAIKSFRKPRRGLAVALCSALIQPVAWSCEPVVDWYADLDKRPTSPAPTTGSAGGSLDVAVQQKADLARYNAATTSVSPNRVRYVFDLAHHTASLEITLPSFAQARRISLHATEDRSNLNAGAVVSISLPPDSHTDRPLRIELAKEHFKYFPGSLSDSIDRLTAAVINGQVYVHLGSDSAREISTSWFIDMHKRLRYSPEAPQGLHDPKLHALATAAPADR